MMFIIVFVFMLYIYDIYYIKNSLDNNKVLKIMCTIFSIGILGFGLYYNMHKYGDSVAYYILKLLNISY